MKRIFPLLLCIALFAPLSAAQFTIVTGTVKDTNGVAYAGGTMDAILVAPGGPSPTLNNLPFTGSTSPIQLDATGSFTARLADNTVISPGGSQWKFIARAGAVLPLGTGPQTCTATLTVSGSSQSISGSFAACPALSVIGSGGTMDTIANGIAYLKHGSISSGAYPWIYNSNFEESTTLPPVDWLPNPHMTCTYETVAPYEGLQSLKCVADTNGSGAQVTTFAGGFPVTPGDTYYIQGAAKSDGVVSAQIRLRFSDKTTLGLPLTSDIIATTNSTSWTFVSASGVVPANAVLGFYSLLSFPLGTAGTTWFDTISVYRVNYPGAIIVPNLGLSATTFASFGTPVNGTFLYCNDCTVANPCAGGGTGAFAKRLNGVWVCN